MIEEVKKIKLLVSYYNQIIKDFRSVLKSLNFSEIDINWYITFAKNYGSGLSEDISMATKIRNTEELLSLFDKNNPLYTKILSDEQVKRRTLDLETDLAYLEYYAQNNIIGNYQDQIFKTKDLINNLILNLTKTTLGSYYALLSPLLPPSTQNDSGYWNVNDILDFLIKYNEIKMSENKSLSLTIK